MDAGITYAKAGGPPDNWLYLRVEDVDTGLIIPEVIEVNTAEGWAIRYKRVNYALVLGPDGPETERITGNFRLVHLPPGPKKV